MIILEKLLSDGLHRIELSVDGNKVTYRSYLNDVCNGTGASVSADVDATFYEQLADFRIDGYTQVNEAGTLKPYPLDDFTLRLSLSEFIEKYPHIKLTTHIWDEREIDVHLEDVLIEGDLDLDTHGKSRSFDIPNNVYLKNLEIQGNIFTMDSDTETSIRVIGDLTAQNMIIGGSEIVVDGHTNIKNTLLLLERDTNSKLNTVSAAVYVVDPDIYWSSFERADFDFSLIFDYDLSESTKEELYEEEYLDLVKRDSYFEGKKKTWINNLNVLSEPEIESFVTDQEITKRINSIINTLKD